MSGDSFAFYVRMYSANIIEGMKGWLPILEREQSLCIGIKS